MPRVADPRARIDLLRAAEAVFAEHGLASARVEDITGRAGVSKGAFYLHFESKDDCWRQIIEGFVARLASCVDPAPPATPAEVGASHPRAGSSDPVEMAESWHRHDLEILEFCWQNRALLRMVLAGGGGAPYAYLIDEFAARMAKNVEAWVRFGIGTGLYRAGLDPAVVSALLSGAYDRLVRELIAQPRRPDLAAWSSQALSLFTRGLLGDEARVVLDREVSVQRERAARADGG